MNSEALMLLRHITVDESNVAAIIKELTDSMQRAEIRKKRYYRTQDNSMCNSPVGSK